MPSSMTGKQPGTPQQPSQSHRQTWPTTPFETGFQPGKNSFQALVGRQVVGPDLVIRTAVYFVAYTKDHGSIEIVSIRFADSQERAIFFGEASGPPRSR